MENKKNNNQIFMIGYGIYVAYFVLFSSGLPESFNIQYLGSFFNILVICLPIMSILVTKKNLIAWVNTTVSILFGCMIFYTSGDSMAFMFCLFVASGITINNFSKVVKLDFVIRFIATCTVLFFNKVNFIPSVYVLRDSGIARNSFGFSHPNTFGAFIMILVIEWIYLRFKNLNYFEILLFLGIVYFLKVKVDPRSSIIAIVIAIILFIIFRLSGEEILKFRLSRILVSCISPLMALLSYFAVINYGGHNPLVEIFDKALSGRIMLINDYFVRYKTNLIGQKVQMFDSSNTGSTYAGFIDNTYMAVLLRYGILFLVLFCFLYIILSYKMSKQYKFSTIMLIITLSIFGLMESTLIYPAFNITCLLLLNFEDEVVIQ